MASSASSLPADHEVLSALEVRMHFPEGAVPKEGPRRVLLWPRLCCQLLLQLPVLPKVALSGEITLTGQVLPVGGLKEKLLAALREGVQKVVLPSAVKPAGSRAPCRVEEGSRHRVRGQFTRGASSCLLGLRARRTEREIGLRELTHGGALLAT